MNAFKAGSPKRLAARHAMSSFRPDRGSDRGSTFIPMLGCLVVALLGATLVLGLGVRASERARLDAVADLVALSAAHEPESIALSVADANRVELQQVTRAGESTIVEVVSGTMRGRASAHLSMGAAECSPGLLHCRGGTRR